MEKFFVGVDETIQKINFKADNLGSLLVVINFLSSSCNDKKQLSFQRTIDFEIHLSIN